MPLLSYHRVRLQIGACLFTLTLFGFVIRIWLATNVNPSWQRESPFEWVATDWAWPLGLALTAAVIGRMLYLGAGDLAALKPLPEGLQVTSFLARRTIAWDQLLGGHPVNYGNLFHRNRWFLVRYIQNGANRTMRIPLILTKRPSGGQMSLSEKIDRARAEALNQPYSPSGERIEGTGMDHDAAIQRYLASKAAAEAANPAAPAGAAAPALTAQPAPARPSFGRKGVSAPHP